MSFFTLAEPVRNPQALLAAIAGALRLRTGLLNGAFLIAAWFTLVVSMGTYRGYQDSWVLETIWPMLLVTLVLYAASVGFEQNLQMVALMASAMIVVGYSAPALKYIYPYASTIDASVHLSMMRTLAEIGRPDPNVYAFTPGFHLIVAAFAQLSGLSIDMSVKLIPALIAGLVPLGAYMLCHQMQADGWLAKSIIALSILSLPVLYIPTGTGYVLPILSLLVMLIVMREQLRRPYIIFVSATIVLLLGQIILWHAISSLIGAVLILSTGCLIMFAMDSSKQLNTRFPWLDSYGVSTFLFGAVGLGLVLLYWRVVATPIWGALATNSQALVATIEGSHTATVDLVPQRAFTLSAMDLLTVFASYHARDILMLTLVGIGLLALLGVLLTRRHVDTPYLVTYYLPLFFVASTILLVVLITGFADQGYRRFLSYVVLLSFAIAGYGFRQIVQLAHRLLGWNRRPIFAILLFGTMLAASLQFYPYQPAMPRFQADIDQAGVDQANIGQADINGEATPLLWHHQVNTEYQRQAIEFVYRDMADDVLVFTSNYGHQQAALFFGDAARGKFTHGEWNRARPAYVLLYQPGVAGAYSEQAEYRSIEAIRSLRETKGASTVYTNGGSFILFAPQDSVEQFILQRTN